VTRSGQRTAIKELNILNLYELEDKQAAAGEQAPNPLSWKQY